MREQKYQSLTDAELLKRFFSTRDNQWLGILLPRYTYLLLGVCMKYLKNEEDARDAVQQIFLRVIAELQKYEVEYFKSWLYMVAKNHCLMRLRNQKNNREFNVPYDEQVGVEPEVNSQKRLQDNEEQMISLEEGLNKLSREQRECLRLFYMEKKTYSEIAAKTGYSVSQVKSYLQNGKRKLKLFMEETAPKND